jgi:hypothetical protein
VTLEGIIIGLIALGVGAAFCFAGFKYFLLLLPIWGFIMGFIFGSNLIFNLSSGDGFFATSLAILSGLLFGVGFAILSYLYYYFAVILLGGAIGYSLGIGFMDWLGGFDGWFAFIVGIVVGGVFAFGFIVLHMPAVLAIWGTAFGGAIAAVAGFLVLFGRVPVGSLNTGGLGAAVADTGLWWLWILAMIGLAIAGGFAQIRLIGTTMESIQQDQYRNPGLPA